MKAMLCSAFGPVTGLTSGELPSPVAGPGQVVIHVTASGVNFFDILMVEGKYQAKPPFPFAPGAEVAGIVESVGAGVSHLERGMRVLALVDWGGYAEEALALASMTFELPEGMSDTAAATFAVTYGTALFALSERGRLTQGETLLVLGAAGGVGLAAVEVGRAMGARVIAAASSEEKLALCRSHGAEATINYASENLRERLKALTAGRGVDVVLDPVGGAQAEPAARSLAALGRYLVVGFAAGDIPRLPLNLLLLKNASAVGVGWGAMTVLRPTLAAELFPRLFAWFAAGKLRPHVAATYPFADCAKALGLLAQRKVLGKIALVP